MKLLNILILVLLAFAASAQESLDQLIEKKLSTLVCEIPSEADPLSINAGIVTSGDSVAVIIKVSIADEWHIYQFVPENMPYVATEYILKLPENVSMQGKWSMSDPIPSSTDYGVMIHEGDAWFIYKTNRTGGASGAVRAGLYYQTCDLRQCLQPMEKTIELSLE